MYVVSHNGVVHKAWPRGIDTLVLACNPASLIRSGNTWWGSWRNGTGLDLNCSKCLVIPLKDAPTVAGADKVEYAIKRKRGTILIPVKSWSVGQSVLLNHEPGWGTIQYRYVTEWTDVEE